MSVPLIPIQVNLPEKGNQPVTYTDYLNTMNCSCVAGAMVIPSPIPSGLFNMGDLLSDLMKFMGVFTSIYKIIAKILKVIGCIIEIFCALMNPFKTIAAVIRFFTVCLPELLELFPQFAILLFIICLIKIILSIIVYVLSVLVPLIEDIITNIVDLKTAIEEGNEDAYMAIAFKIVSLFDELRSILALFALLSPIFEMIKSLLAAGIAIPCKGSDEEDPECPSVFNNMEYTGSDGHFMAIFGPNGPLDYNLYFTTESNKDTLKKLSGFFPPGINYDEMESVDSAPYSLTIDDSDSFLVTKIDDSGKVFLKPTSSQFATDGYLSSVVMVDGYKQNINSNFVRMGTPIGKFTNSMVGKYITIIDIRSNHNDNSGTWKIEEIYDSKNIKLSREGDGDWIDIHNTLAREALLYPIPYIFWKLVPIFPENGTNKNYVFSINHAELIRHNEISVGCHPAVKASIAAAANRFPDINEEPLPILPDVDAVIAGVNAVVDKVVPKGSDTQYILDNYLEIEANVVNIIPEISVILNKFQEDCLTYIQLIFPKVFDPERSILDANPKIQLIGNPININIVAYDRSGDVMGKGLPPGLITAESFTTEGTISSTEEVLAEDGSVIGKFEATLNSDIPLKAQITAKVLDRDISDFNGNILIPRIIEVEFVEPSELARRRGHIDTSNEPLGSGRKG